MEKSITEVPKRTDGGKLNHGGWVRIEGKQVAVLGIWGGIRVTESSRHKFSDIDLKLEEVRWLNKFAIAKEEGWRWVDSWMANGNNRLFTKDMANEVWR